MSLGSDIPKVVESSTLADIPPQKDVPDGSGKTLKDFSVPDGSGKSLLDDLRDQTQSQVMPDEFREGNTADVPENNNMSGYNSLPKWMENTNEEVRPSPKDSERKALELYGGREQVSFLNGQEVPYGTPGATRPDIVREVDTGIEAIEVKNYDLSNLNRVKSLVSELKRQIGQRVDDLPNNSNQRIVLDTRGQNLTNKQVDNVVNQIKDALKETYPDIPVDTIQE